MVMSGDEWKSLVEEGVLDEYEPTDPSEYGLTDKQIPEFFEGLKRDADAGRKFYAVVNGKEIRGDMSIDKMYQAAFGMSKEEYLKSVENKAPATESKMNSNLFSKGSEKGKGLEKGNVKE